MATPIVMPKQGQSVETCVINQWMKKPGETVKQGEVLFSYETDKASFEFESPVAGTLLEIFTKPQDDVPVLTNVAAVGNPGEDVSSLRPSGSAPTAPASADESTAKPETAAPTVAVVASSTADGMVRVSPRARNKSETRGVDLTTLVGSGPQGRIIERDVLAAPSATSSAVARAAATGLSAPAKGSGPGGKALSSDLVKKMLLGAPAPIEDTITDVKLANIRKIIGQRMHQSLQQSAQLTMNMSADATALLAYRKNVKARGKELGLSDITVTDLIALAVAKTLPAFPEINSIYKDDKLTQYAHVHLAMAVDTPRGLMVPVVRFADRHSLSDLSSALKGLAQQCKEGSINPDLLSGGTITITNLGMFGVESFTPILNAPQVAIIGVNGIKPQPVAKDDGGYEFRQHLGLSLTIDHRVVDGAPGARFLKTLCDNIANIGFMLSVW